MLVATYTSSSLENWFSMSVSFIGPNKWGRSLHGIEGNMLDCDVVVNNSKIQSHYYIHFWANTLMKGINPLIPPSYGLNSTTTVLLEVWLWHWITQEGWYAVKQRNQTKQINVWRCWVRTVGGIRRYCSAMCCDCLCRLVYTLLAGPRLQWLYPQQKSKTPSKKNVLSMTWDNSGEAPVLELCHYSQIHLLSVTYLQKKWYQWPRFKSSIRLFHCAYIWERHESIYFSPNYG